MAAGRRAQTQTGVQAKMAELSRKYQADSEWQKAFDKSDRLFFYTIELQRVLIRKDGRPVIVVATIDDVVGQSDGRYALHAHMTVGLDRDVHFELRCGVPELRALLDRTPEILDEFVIVARIQEIRKPLLQAVAQSGDEVVNTPEVVLEPSRTLFASGECLDAVFVER
jgi:hypothetical protein